MFPLLFYINKVKLRYSLGRPSRSDFVQLEFVEFLNGYRFTKRELNELKNVISSIDIILDISGFNLGKKWSVEIQERYLEIIRLAKAYYIPILLLPQSFGPFDYSGKKKYLLEKIDALLSYPVCIFAREESGKEMLERSFNLRNVKLSSDLVLQNENVDINNIFTRKVDLIVPSVKDNSVGIVPNKQCFTHGDKEKNFHIYMSIIDYLLKKGYDIYILRHSAPDLNVCNQIYEPYSTNESVHLLKNDFNCFEYEKLVSCFKFIVCSRYHGIVHAYKNYIPCIILGWAIKYKDLAKLVGQEYYSLDITDENTTKNLVIDRVETMLRNYEKDSAQIERRLQPIRHNNVFVEVENIINSIIREK